MPKLCGRPLRGAIYSDDSGWYVVVDEAKLGLVKGREYRVKICDLLLESLVLDEEADKEGSMLTAANPWERLVSRPFNRAASTSCSMSSLLELREPCLERN